jgi:hypothetical protein
MVLRGLFTDGCEWDIDDFEVVFYDSLKTAVLESLNLALEHFEKDQTYETHIPNSTVREKINKDIDNIQKMDDPSEIHKYAWANNYLRDYSKKSYSNIEYFEYGNDWSDYQIKITKVVLSN